MMRNLLVIVFAILLAAPSWAAEPAKQVIPHAQSVPPGPALSPEEAIRKMTVPEGFTVELVASEPDLVNPVAMTFDERGRVWVTESVEYPRSSAGKGRDRVKVLEDTDGDGKADKFTIFAEGLNIPSGIAVGYGGVWVANSPDILFMQDTDGDGRADKQEVVVTGFGRADTHELPNSLTWGPDGWLYGLNGVFNPSKVTHKGKTHEFTCAMFRIHPRTRDFEIFCEGTSNPWGIAIDKEGSFFVSACVIDHLWHLVETGYYHRQGGPYPPFTWKIESIVQHKHQKAAYCGIHYFDSDAYPEQYREKLYMGNIHGNCINVDRLERNGSTYRGLPEPDFLTANDAWFMPVVQKTGPDGCLYILDWYDRYHCYQDARRDPEGIDRLKGRLYRVRYRGTPRAPKFDLTKETDEQLIERLKSPNVFYRDVAQRLLGERSNTETIDRLKQFVRDEQVDRKHRLLGYWALIHHANLDPQFFIGAHQAFPDPTMQAWTVRAAKQFVDDVDISTAHPDVLLQLTINAARYGANKRLIEICERANDDLFLARIAWRGLSRTLLTHSGDFAAELRKANFDAPALKNIVPRAFEVMATLKANKFDEANHLHFLSLLAHLLDREDSSSRALATECLSSLIQKLRDRELSDEQFQVLKSAQFVQSLLRKTAASDERSLANLATAVLACTGDSASCDAVSLIALNDANSPMDRIRAVESLIVGQSPGVITLVDRMISSDTTPADVRRGLIIAMGRLDSSEVAELAVRLHAKSDASLQPLIVELLTQRETWRHALVSAVSTKKISPEAVNVNQLRQLLSSKDKSLVDRATAIWGTVRTDRNPQREQVVAEMRNLLKNNSGDPHKGIAAFNKLCGQCHKIYGQGQDVGPDITVNGRASLDQLLSNIFDPSLVIGRIYQAYTVVTTDGRTLTGLLVEDGPQRVVLKVQGGKIETIARKDVEEIAQSKLSMMPEGVEKQLTPQELLDLLAFLRLDNPPSDPTAKLIPDVKK